jgi:hypothetical protein
MQRFGEPKQAAYLNTTLVKRKWCFIEGYSIIIFFTIEVELLAKLIK